MKCSVKLGGGGGGKGVEGGGEGEVCFQGLYYNSYNSSRTRRERAPVAWLVDHRNSIRDARGGTTAGEIATSFSGSLFSASIDSFSQRQWRQRRETLGTRLEKLLPLY